MSNDIGLCFIAWSRIWSSLVPDEWRSDAWENLSLPDDFQTHEGEYWSTFHLGDPTPKVSLLLHAALSLDGSAVRETWMRASQFLGLKRGSAVLPPDHLGPVCEAFAIALEREDRVLVRELADRFLLPWSRLAVETLQNSDVMLDAVTAFERDINEVVSMHAE